MTTIILASNNSGKLKEFQYAFAEFNVKIISQKEFSIQSIDENGLTFVENALLKARQVCKFTKQPAIADDSGLTVDALEGQPGIISARYSGEAATDEANNKKLLTELNDIPAEKRQAQFHCVLVYLRHANDPAPIICHGLWQGFITEIPQGENGFGYDPLFYIPELKCTSAQLKTTEKNKISHRGQAVTAMLKQFKYSNV